MTSEAWVTLGIGALGLILQTVALIIGGIIALSRTKDQIIEQLTDHKIQTEEKLNLLRREPGETFTALRQKINEVELYIRDHFVQRESFQAIITQIMGDMKSIGDRIEARLLRMESKIDRVNHDGN